MKLDTEEIMSTATASGSNDRYFWAPTQWKEGKRTVEGWGMWKKSKPMDAYYEENPEYRSTTLEKVIKVADNRAESEARWDEERKARDEEQKARDEEWKKATRQSNGRFWYAPCISTNGEKGYEVGREGELPALHSDDLFLSLEAAKTRSSHRRNSLNSNRESTGFSSAVLKRCIEHSSPTELWINYSVRITKSLSD